MEKRILKPNGLCQVRRVRRWERSSKGERVGVKGGKVTEMRLDKSGTQEGFVNSVQESGLHPEGNSVSLKGFKPENDRINLLLKKTPLRDV